MYVEEPVFNILIYGNVVITEFMQFQYNFYMGHLL